jgi:DNA polymerase III subunit epsilon
MAFLVLDTETTGFPLKNLKATAKNIFNWNTCRIVQIAWEVYANIESEAPITRKCYMIRPNGFTIPTDSSAIHGIYHDEALAQGIPLSQAIDELMNDIIVHETQTIVAHNMSFDSNAILSEMFRAKSEYALTWQVLDKYCTMMKGTRRGGKWQKLEALYQTLIGPLDQGMLLHRADVDTKLCAAVYKEQMKQ